MISTGSKGWIKKYFAMVKKGEIKVNLPSFSEDKQHNKHLVFSNSGIIFGFPSQFIFAKKVKKVKWTIDEQLQFLLFESHLFIYLSNGGSVKEDYTHFVNSILDFYEHHSIFSVGKLLTFYFKESPEEKLENLIVKRVEIRKTFLESANWVNYLSNTFVYLDVLLYDEFLNTNRSLTLSNYENYAETALYTLILTAQSDGVIELREKHIFEVFLASAKIPDKKKEEIEQLLLSNVPFTILSTSFLKNNNFKRFLLDIAVLTVIANHEVESNDREFLVRFSKHLKFREEVLNESLVMVENFVIKHNDEIAFLSNSSSVEKLYSNVSKRWIKILGRNKDKLVLELKHNKELVSLIKKSTTKELSKEEKEKVKSQFLDLIKSMPALAIFMLPGGALLLPIVLKIIPDLIPSAFRDNEVE